MVIDGYIIWYCYRKRFSKIKFTTPASREVLPKAVRKLVRPECQMRLHHSNPSERVSDQRIFTWQYSPYLRSWETLGQWGRRGGRRGSLGRRPGSLNIFLLQKKKEECKLKLDFIWTGDGMSYSRFSGNLCTFCGWRVTFVRVGCGAVVHETIHVFKRDLGRGSQHLGEGSGIFEYLYISLFSSSCCTFEDPPGPLG